MVVLKLWLGARDDVKEGRRPLVRNRALGDMGGLKTPFVPFCPDDKGRGDVILDGYSTLLSDVMGVCEVIEAVDVRLVRTENCGGDVVGEGDTC
jgi:hypothetical protein